MISLRLLATAASLLFALPLTAQEAPIANDTEAPSQTGFYAGVNLSTMGIGLEADWQFHDRWALRGGVNYGVYGLSETVNGIKYDYDINLLSGGAVVDFYPWAGRGWRLSAGGRLNGNNIDVYASPQFDEGPLDPLLGATSPSFIEGDITVSPFSPIATVGWRSQRGGRWVIALDAGVMAQFDLDASFRTADDRMSNPLVRAQLDEQERQTEDDVAYLQWVPILSLTAHFRF